MHQSIKEALGIDADKLSVKELIKFARKNKIEVNKKASKGEIITALFEEFVEPKLIQPTFIMDYPIEISPLAKKKKDNPELTERFEIFIGGLECGNGFSELNDPIDQKERFEQQAKRKRLETRKRIPWTRILLKL